MTPCFWGYEFFPYIKNSTKGLNKRRLEGLDTLGGMACLVGCPFLACYFLEALLYVVGLYIFYLTSPINLATSGVL
jgi:hypothetical protein